MNKFDILGLALAIAGGVMIGVIATPRSPETILVGEGCEGGSPIAVAREEDKLPRCHTISRHEVQH